jgi:hypothetical protein
MRQAKTAGRETGGFGGGQLQENSGDGCPFKLGVTGQYSSYGLVTYGSFALRLVILVPSGSKVWQNSELGCMCSAKSQHLTAWAAWCLRLRV